MARLTAGVVLRDPATGAAAYLPPGSTCPEWALEFLGDHVLTDRAEDDESTDMPDLDELDPDDPAAAATGAVPPPKSGSGSGRAAWTAYAAANDVAVADGASRDEIIEACEAAGVPTT